MIVVDPSALIAILFNEPSQDDRRRALSQAEAVCISAGTLAEALIVAGRRGLADDLVALVDAIGCEVVPVEGRDARDVSAAHLRWGKGRSPAKLNFGDCFAYALAHKRRAPLLFVGDDFRRTDVSVVLAT